MYNSYRKKRHWGGWIEEVFGSFIGWSHFNTFDKKWLRKGRSRWKQRKGQILGDRLWGDGNVWDPAYKHGIVLQLAKEINCYWHRMRDVGIGGWCGLKVNGF